MFQTINTGPCGSSFSQIVAMADTLNRHAARFGLSDAEQVHRLLAIVGVKLTAVFSLPEYPACLPTYRQYVTRAKADIFEQFDIVDLLHTCADLGCHSGSPAEDVRLDDATDFFLSSFCNLRVAMNVPPTDFLDLVAWMQCVLGLRLVCAEDADLAAQVGLTQGSSTDAA